MKITVYLWFSFYVVFKNIFHILLDIRENYFNVFFLTGINFYFIVIFVITIYSLRDPYFNEKCFILIFGLITKQSLKNSNRLIKFVVFSLFLFLNHSLFVNPNYINCTLTLNLRKIYFRLFYYVFIFFLLPRRENT